MKKITTLKEVHDMFELLNIQRCDTNAQRKRGTSVYKLPHDLCYPNGNTIAVKFAEYASGYVRRVEADYTSGKLIKHARKKSITKIILGIVITLSKLLQVNTVDHTQQNVY